jgi:xanthine dehydrogenase large subunit
MNDAGSPALNAAAWTQVGRSRPHESARLHVLGQADYTDDIAEVRGTLHAALGLSARAHARILDIDLAPVRAGRGVHAVYTARDIPGTNDCGPIIHDDPILADGLVQYVGQPMFIVVADTHDNARRAARLALVTYEELPAILTPQAARAAQSYVLPPMRLQRGARKPRSSARRTAWPANCTWAARNSFTWKGKSPTRCRRKTTACWCNARPSTRARCSTWWRMRWDCIRTT